MKPFHRNMSRRLIDALSTSGIKRGMGPSQRYLLTVAGRKSGTPHTTPVSVVIDGSARHLVAPYGEVGWVRNARSAGMVTLAGEGLQRTVSAGSARAGAGGTHSEPLPQTGADHKAQAFEVEVQAHPVFSLTRVTATS